MCRLIKCPKDLLRELFNLADILSVIYLTFSGTNQRECINEKAVD